MWDRVQSLLLEKFEVAAPFAGLDVYRKLWDKKLDFFQSKGLFVDGLTMSTTTQDNLSYDAYKHMIVGTINTDTPAWERMLEKMPESFSLDSRTLRNAIQNIFLNEVTIDEARKNKLSGPRASLPAGAKASKLTTLLIAKQIKNYVAEDDMATATEAINQLMSLVFANAKVSNSEVVLSIDPVDILLGSMGTTGWSSCYDWSSLSGGAHATAPFKLVTDPHTAVAYMKATGVVKVFGLDVPVKKNRAWVFFNAKYPAAVVGRIFPNDNTAFSEATTELCTKALGTMYTCQELVTSRQLSKEGIPIVVDLPKPKAAWLYSDPWTEMILDRAVVHVVQAVSGYNSHSPLCLTPPDFDSQFMSMADMTAWCPKCGSLRADYSSRNRVVCPNCERLLRDERRTIHDIVQCAHCNLEVRKAVTTDIDRVGAVCPACLDSHYVRCAHCDAWHEKVATYAFKGKRYCRTCLTHVGVYRCNSCGSLHPLDLQEKDVHGMAIPYCPSCIGKAYARCSICGEYVLKNAAVVAGSGYICDKPDCRGAIKICRRCGKATAVEIKVLHRNGVRGLWCPSCRDKVTTTIPEYKLCATCGTWVHQNKEGECCGQEE